MDRPHFRPTFSLTLVLALILTAAALLASAAPAAANVLPTHMLWNDLYAPTVAVDSYEAVAPTIDGGFVAAGSTNDDGFGSAAGADMLVTKFKADDAAVPHVEWTRTWDSPIDHLADHALAVQTDLLGNVIVCGYTTRVGGARNFAVVKWNAAGAFQWSHIFAADVAGGDTIAYDVTCDGAADIYVCGTTETAAGVSSLVVHKLTADAPGDEMWKGLYAGPAGSYNQGSAIALDEFANCYVVGYGERIADADADIILTKFNQTGGFMWARHIDSPGHGSDQGIDLVVGTNAVTITGNRSANLAGTRHSTAVARYTLSGSRKWLRTWRETSSASSWPRALTGDAYGNVAVAGTSTRAGGVAHAFLAKWNKDGTRKWAKVSYGSGNKRSFEDVVARGGTFWVAGATSDGVTGSLVARYASDGSRQWLSVWPGGGGIGDGFRALCLGVGSGVFAGGYSGQFLTGDDAQAAKYTR